MDGLGALELVMRGAAIGCLLATGVGLWRDGGPKVGPAGLAFALSVIGYAINSSPTLQMAMGPAAPAAHAASLVGVGFFWAFIRALFEDRALDREAAAPSAALLAVGLAGAAAPASIDHWFWLIHNGLQIALGAHALWIIVRSAAGDLVDARRRLRRGFLGVVTCYLIILSAAQIGESFGVQPDWYPLAGAGALAALSIAGALVLLGPREALLGAPAAAAPRTLAQARQDPDDGEIARLAALMTTGEAWRREGLTIGDLAQDLALPEHRLRALINDRLGHRNFAAFINLHRIEAAKAALADPGRARQTIAAIAFEHGFASLGPFNRAFKEATGLTPTQWRQLARGEGSPKPENPG